MAADRFSEVNEVLAACVAEVQGKVAAYRKNQERIGKDKTPAIASPLGEAQTSAMAREAVSSRGSALVSAAVASVLAEIKLG